MSRNGIKEGLNLPSQRSNNLILLEGIRGADFNNFWIQQDRIHFSF